MRSLSAAEHVVSPGIVPHHQGAPSCGHCHVPMWMTRHSRTFTDEGAAIRCEYECKQCGAFEVEAF